MSEAIIVAIITGLISLIGAFISAKSNRDKITQELKINMAVVENEMKNMNQKIEEHNGYAKMFQENIPAIKQHMTDVDRRLENLEKS